jgi:hypothetical protein
VTFGERRRRGQREKNFDKGPTQSQIFGPLDGVVAQLVEHHNGIVGVRGSNPLGSTILAGSIAVSMNGPSFFQTIEFRTDLIQIPYFDAPFFGSNSKIACIGTKRHIANK